MGQLLRLSNTIETDRDYDAGLQNVRSQRKAHWVETHAALALPLRQAAQDGSLARRRLQYRRVSRRRAGRPRVRSSNSRRGLCRPRSGRRARCPTRPWRLRPAPPRGGDGMRLRLEWIEGIPHILF